MTITQEDVRHVAQLARLALDDAQVATMADELGSILEHIGKIGELDLEGVEPLTHAVDVVNVLGADVPHESLSHDEALRNAPDANEAGFQVPRMRS